MTTQTLDQHGDAIERAYASFIATHLAGYVALWADFVGNDGTSHLRPRASESNEARAKREKLSQRIYTVLESVIACKQIQEGEFQAPHGTAEEQARAALDVSNRLMLFYAHLGRIRDNIKRVGEAWGRHDLALALGTFYTERCVVLHGSKMPFGTYENSVTTVWPGAVASNKVTWDDKTRAWSDVSAGDLLPLADILRDTFAKLLPHVETAFRRLYDAVANELGSPSWLGTDLSNFVGSPTTVSGVIAPKGR